MEKIKIKQKEPITGSVEWLKGAINNGKFKFSTTVDGEPCVVFSYYERKNDQLTKKYTKIVAFISNGRSDGVMFYREYREICCIIKPYVRGYEEEPTLFPYLTDAAIENCDRIIKQVADELINKVQGDNGSLNIQVIVN